MGRKQGLLEDCDGIGNQSHMRLVRHEFNSISSRYLRAVTTDRDDFTADLSWLPELSRLRVLNVACGPGTYSTALSELGSRVVGLDLAENMLRCASQRQLRLTTFVQGDAAQLPFATGAFDVCFCAFSFAHFPTPRQVLKEMTRVLRPKGILAIVDVVAPEDREQSALLNRLERFREKCYTCIRASSDFLKVLSTLPMRRELWGIETRAVSFDQWIAASHFHPGSVSFRRARRLFYETAKVQHGTGTSPFLVKSHLYRYRVAWFLLRKTI